MTKPARTLFFGLAAAFGLFLLSFLIRPEGLAANNGLSYYGDFKTTIIPYSLAFFVSAYAYFEAAKGVDARTTIGRYLAFSMRVMAVLFIGLLITPSALVNPIHTVLGSGLFSFQLIVSCWLFGWYLKDWLGGVLLSLELFGGLASFYYLERTDGLLLQAQVLFQIAFGLLLVRVLNNPSMRRKAVHQHE